MNSKEKADLLVRLLQLEQRFESYSRLYEEEMGEIRETVLRLREDVLKLAQADSHNPTAETSLDHFSADMSI